MDLLIALIPALPLAGFLFAVLAGSRLDHVPVHGHGHGADEHDADDHDDRRRPRRGRLGLPARPDRGGAAGNQPARRARRRPGQCGRRRWGHPARAERRARPDRTRDGRCRAAALSVLDRADRPGGRHVDPEHDRVRERDLRRERVRGHHLRVDLVGRLPHRDQLPRRLADRDAPAGGQHRRLPGPRVLDRLHGRRPRILALLRLPEPLHVQHAAADPGRQLRDALRWLGGGRALQLRAHRLLVQEALRCRGRQEGVHRQPRRRLRVRPRDHHALGQPRDAELPRGLRADRDARRGHGHGHRAAALRRRRRQERAVPAPCLAAGRDGGPDPGQRAHPRRDDGQCRRLPGRARQSRSSPRRRPPCGWWPASASSRPSSPPPSR